MLEPKVDNFYCHRDQGIFRIKNIYNKYGYMEVICLKDMSTEELWNWSLFAAEIRPITSNLALLEAVYA
jgi:hypothetical protein